jgi:hypothetical protein
MIYAILVSIAISVLLFCWVFYKRNIELFLCLLIAINFEFFHLLPRIKGPDDYKLLLLPIVFILLAERLLSRKLALGRYGWWVVAFLSISVMGIVVANFSGQSLSLGIKAAKFVPLILVYFVLQGRAIDANKFVNYFVTMSLTVAGIATAQYLLHNKFIIFTALPKDILFGIEGPIRITVGQFVIAAATVVAAARYFQSSNLMFLIAAVGFFLEIVFIQKTRGFIAGVFLSIFAVYVLSHKITLLRISFYLIFAGLLMGSWLIISDIKIDRIAIIDRTRLDIEKQRGSFQGRINAYMYYWKEIQKKPLTGRGLFNYNWEGNSEKKIQQTGIHLSDIGITHFIVEAGLIGLIWLIYGLFRMWLDIVYNSETIIVSSYFVVATFTMPTLDMFMRVDTLFLFAVFLGLTSCMYSVDKPLAAKA